MNNQYAQIACDFMHRKGTRRRLGIVNNFTALGGHQFARNARCFLRLALGVADHQFDLAPAEAAGGIEFFHFHLCGIGRRLTKHRDASRQDRRHADADRLVLRERQVRKAQRGHARHRGRALQQLAALRLRGLWVVGFFVAFGAHGLVSQMISNRSVGCRRVPFIQAEASCRFNAIGCCPCRVYLY